LALVALLLAARLKALLAVAHMLLAQQKKVSVLRLQRVVQHWVLDLAVL
jgi:hypothetical protein